MNPTASSLLADGVPSEITDMLTVLEDALNSFYEAVRRPLEASLCDAAVLLIGALEELATAAHYPGFQTARAPDPLTMQQLLRDESIESLAREIGLSAEALEYARMLADEKPRPKTQEEFDDLLSIAVNHAHAYARLVTGFRVARRAERHLAIVVTADELPVDPDLARHFATSPTEYRRFLTGLAAIRAHVRARDAARDAARRRRHATVSRPAR